MSFNILFTSAGRRIELMRAFKSAYERLGLEGKIVVLDCDKLAPTTMEDDVVSYIVPRLEEPGFTSALIGICEDEEIDLIFPLIDPDIRFLAEHKEEIEATGARLAVVSKHAATIVGDKWLTNDFFRELSLVVPRSWLPDEFRSDITEFPLFIKPRFGSAASHTYKVCDEDELSYIVSKVPDPIIQEFIPGPEITNDVICDITGEVLAVVSRKRIEVRCGEVQKGITIYDQKIIDSCVKIAKALPAVGPITVQCLTKDGEPHFTEVNARFGGGFPLTVAANVDAPLWLLARATGMDVYIPPIGEYEIGLAMTRFDSTFFIAQDKD